LIIKGSQASEILVSKGKRICTSKDIRELFGERYLPAISRLTNARWILPIKGFRGIYYVLDLEEREGHFLKMGGFSVLLVVLNKILGRKWYFGGVSAFSLSGLIHQPASVNYVFNKRYSKTIDSNVFGKVVLVKTSASIGKKCGIKLREYQGIPFAMSSLERNLADYLYLHVHGHSSKKHIDKLYNNYRAAIGKEELVEMVFRCYPKKSAIKMISVLREVGK
jgi:hypothetical protein